LRELLLLDAEDSERDISLYINSPARITDGLAIYDTMQYVNADIRTICIGMARQWGSSAVRRGAGKRSRCRAVES